MTHSMQLSPLSIGFVRSATYKLPYTLCNKWSKPNTYSQCLHLSRDSNKLYIVQHCLQASVLVWAAMTKHHRLRGLHDKYLFLTSFNPNYLQRRHLQIPSHWELELQDVIRRDTNIQSIAHSLYNTNESSSPFSSVNLGKTKSYSLAFIC